MIHICFQYEIIKPVINQKVNHFLNLVWYFVVIFPQCVSSSLAEAEPIQKTLFHTVFHINMIFAERSGAEVMLTAEMPTEKK